MEPSFTGSQETASRGLAPGLSDQSSWREAVAWTPPLSGLCAKALCMTPPTQTPTVRCAWSLHWALQSGATSSPDALTLGECHPHLADQNPIKHLSPPSPPTSNLSQHQGLFQCVGSSHQVTKVLELFSISPSHEYSGLISFRMDWLDLLAVQETLKSLLQHHSSKHQFLSAQLSSQPNTPIH